MSKRIIHVIWSAQFGGIEKLVHDLITVQQSVQELDVALLIAKPEGDYLQSFKNLDVKVFTLSLKNGHNISVSNYKKAKQIFSQFDIIHIHSFNPLVSYAAKNSGKIIIYTEHGNFGYGKNKSLSTEVILKMQTYFLNNSVDFITYNSFHCKNISEERYNSYSVENKVIYNGIVIPYSPSVPDAAVTTAIEGKFVVGTVSRLAAVKRIEILINIFGAFKKDKDVKLLIIGDGPQMQLLKECAAKNKVAGDVLFAGYRENARDYYQLMDVCAFTSANESFGLVAIEALDAGKPVVVFKESGGLAEIVSLISPKDSVSSNDEFVYRLEYYFNSPPSNQNKMKSFAADFSIKSTAEKYLDIYNQLCVE
jgi:glycosyltransferase involved in cell wall biosynthesis